MLTAVGPREQLPWSSPLGVAQESLSSLCVLLGLIELLSVQQASSTLQGAGRVPPPQHSLAADGPALSFRKQGDL